jgi:ABC-type nitrate/sulfonate/bicarbonate transport system permease component
VGLAGLLAAWWAVTYLHLVPTVFLPPPGQVAGIMVDNFFSSPYLAQYNLGSGGFSTSLLYTIESVLLALAIACGLGVSLGLASARLRGLRAVVDPVLMAAGTIPIIVTAPFFLIWFGTGRGGQLALLVLYATVIIYMFAQRGVENLDPIYEAGARTMGAGRARVLTDVYLRGTLPQLLGGVRIALAGAWGLEAFAELLGAPNGIGRVIQGLASSTDIPSIVAVIMLLAIAAVAFDAIVASVFGYLTRWRPSHEAA